MALAKRSNIEECQGLVALEELERGDLAFRVGEKVVSLRGRVCARRQIWDVPLMMRQKMQDMAR